jgi:hypothetical protein
MNRTGLGLAMGAGYALGRTRKLRLALVVGSLVAARRLHLTPRAVTDLVAGRLRDNPRFKEIGNQLREDLRGAGRAASGAVVERQLDAFADRLHVRTAEVRDRLVGVVPGGRDEEDVQGEGEDVGDRPRRKGASRKAPAKKAVARAPAKKTARKAPAKQAAPRGAAGKKTAAAQRTGAGARVQKGGGGR